MEEHSSLVLGNGPIKGGGPADIRTEVKKGNIVEVVEAEPDRNQDEELDIDQHKKVRPPVEKLIIRL